MVSATRRCGARWWSAKWWMRARPAWHSPATRRRPARSDFDRRGGRPGRSGGERARESGTHDLAQPVRRAFAPGGSSGQPLLPAPIEEELAHWSSACTGLWAKGRPQDIEWAYDGEHLWLLQARPVTTLPRMGWPETAALPRYWSTANLKDSLPGVICELSWSLLSDVVGEVLWAAPNAVGIRDSTCMEVSAAFRGASTSISP